MAFTRVYRFGLVVVAALSAGACEEMACEVGCDEEEADCLDNPEAYVLGSCGRVTGPSPNACERQYCEALLEQCRRDCRTTDLSR